jgi:hypothetical protein
VVVILTLIPDQFINLIVPAKHNFEHVQTQIIWGPFRSEFGGSERHIGESGLGEGKEVCLFRPLHFFGTPYDLLS